MTEKITLTTQNDVLKQIKRGLKNKLGDYQKEVKDIYIYDFSLGKDSFEVTFHAEIDDEDVIERIEHLVLLALKGVQMELLLYNVCGITLGEKEEVTYETISFDSVSFSENEMELLKEFAAYAKVGDDMLENFITNEIKHLTCLQDLLNMPVNDLMHYTSTWETPEEIKEEIYELFFVDRYVTYSLREVVEKLQEVIKEDELEEGTNYDQGFLKEMMEVKFGSMKYDW